MDQLGPMRQYLGEDLDFYVKIFHEKTLDCSGPVNEEVLVNVCLHGMTDKYSAFSENSLFLFP